MAGIRIEGGVSGNVAEVDATFKTVKTAIYPVESTGFLSIGAVSGLATVIAAGGPVFSFRNISANLIRVRRVAVGFVTTTAFTTAQGLRYDLFFARAFTASDTGGTAIALTGSQNKLRTSLATLTSVDCRISTTAALTAGTRTLDTVALGMVCGTSNGVGTTVPVQTLFDVSAGDYPLVLAQNEGFVITNGQVMGAAGVGNIIVCMEFAEATAF